MVTIYAYSLPAPSGKLQRLQLGQRDDGGDVEIMFLICSPSAALEAASWYLFCLWVNSCLVLEHLNITREIVLAQTRAHCFHFQATELVFKNGLHFYLYTKTYFNLILL